jgi:hypothetical protein
MDDLAIASDTLDIETRLGNDVPDRLADEFAAFGNSVGAHFDAAIGGDDPGRRALAAADTCLVFRACLCQIDTHQAWPDLGKEPGSADNTNELGNRKCDRNVVGHGRPCGVVDPKVCNSVPCGADCR